ncbi:hypothetical protein [Aurantimonas sp. VKM B-3413]|uniref:hypothetical protein n=1 Tax=Aurantimonas sp. VKM B-3413 TaxID=2779401 RepID=UPI001E449A3A|nr:hypothetical protein [Aurantimonas sp. VKM B-3413]MCB8838185.1 hypothetical protein [Aurantimonas sp. VKM B-3413]
MAACAVFLFAHPAALSSDDALYFSRGLVRFSILDFSPQFPGYPGFIALGRLLVPVAGGDPVAALFDLSVLSALALPPLVAWTSFALTGRAAAALAGFVLALAQPLLPTLALSLLSDGTGLAFLLLFLALLAASRGRAGTVFLAGIALGIAACCRPSYAALFAGALTGLAFTRPRDLVPAIAGALVVGIPALLFLLSREGTLLITEGLRFTLGHTLIWGNTVLAAAPAGGPRGGWWSAVAAIPLGLPLAFATLVPPALALTRSGPRRPAIAATVGAFLGHLVWVLLMQNPDHLRHLAPLPFLSAILAGLLVAERRRVGTAIAAVLLALEILVSASNLGGNAFAGPPLARAAATLRAMPPGSALATNEGVALLRTGLPQLRVYDMRYPADAAYGLGRAAGERLRLSTTRLSAGKVVREFPGRFSGEESLYLYRATDAAEIAAMLR